jgi:hypothetical protein
MQGLVVATALALSRGAYAQTCDDFNPCTVNDMCSGDDCMGTFQAGESCDDFEECTVNDRCQNDPILGGICRGDPAPVGTSCSGGCGTCQAISPTVTTCVGGPGNAGAPCDMGFGPCVEGKCQFSPINMTVLCAPELKVCPDTDGNPCTDNCDFETGECEVNVGNAKCNKTCEACNPSTGQCEPANEGRACDDFNACTPDSRCEATDIGGGVKGGFCLPGESIDGCVGDCNSNGTVVVNELIIGVNIALGRADVRQCTAFDTNSNGGVEVNELVGGVNALLNGCA